MHVVDSYRTAFFQRAGGRSTSYSEATVATGASGTTASTTTGGDNVVPEEEQVANGSNEASQKKDKLGGDKNDTDAIKHESGDQAAEHASKPAAVPAMPGGPPKSPPFRFFHLLHAVHERVVDLPG